MKALLRGALACLLLLVGACADMAQYSVKSTADLIEPGRNDARKIGIALAGGGTKAGAYSLGVLAGTAIDDKELARITAISSVSGGGYASLFLFSKLMLRDSKRAMALDGRLDVGAFFKDCIPKHYSGYLPENVGRGRGSASGPVTCSDDPDELRNFRFQQFVRCRQDLLENECDPSSENNAPATVANTNLLIGATFAAVPFNFVARSAFDWPINLSPSRYAYRRGIGTAYGLYPMAPTAASSRIPIRDICNDSHFLNCELMPLWAQVKAGGEDGLTFENLGNAIGSNRKHAHPIPTWIINATTSRSRSVFGWAQKGQRNFSRYTLQKSPYGARSGHYGDLTAQTQDIDLLDAVTASAAFLDANQTLYQQPQRMALALLLHSLALDWGVDIPNPNVNESFRVTHRFLPFPFYFAGGGYRYLVAPDRPETHSAYIRLLDGGNNDNTGAFSLIEAGMDDIVIADNAEDQGAVLNNLCLLRNEIRKRPIYGSTGPEYELVVPGLMKFHSHCNTLKLESEGDDTILVNGRLMNIVDPAAQPARDIVGTVPAAASKDQIQDEIRAAAGSYSIYDWPHKALLGCIRKRNVPIKVNEDEDGPNRIEMIARPDCHGTYRRGSGDRQGEIAARVYILKPAINAKEFYEKYTLRDAALNRKVAPAACSVDEPGLCEVAAFIATRYPNGPPKEGNGEFPQNTTVGMTFATDSLTFGAYRELGRWHMNDAWKYIEQTNDAFAASARRQGGTQVKFTPE